MCNMTHSHVQHFYVQHSFLQQSCSLVSATWLDLQHDWVSESCCTCAALCCQLPTWLAHFAHVQHSFLRHDWMTGSHVQHDSLTFLDGYCSTVQGLIDWFEVDLGFTELLFIQIDLCNMTWSHVQHDSLTRAIWLIQCNSLTHYLIWADYQEIYQFEYSVEFPDGRVLHNVRNHYQTKPTFYQNSPIIYQKSNTLYLQTAKFSTTYAIVIKKSSTFYQNSPISYQKSPLPVLSEKSIKRARHSIKSFRILCWTSWR